MRNREARGKSHTRRCSLSCTFLSAGQGGCKTNSECETGLICEDGIGKKHGFAPQISVCISKCQSDPHHPDCETVRCETSVFICLSQKK